MYYLLIQPEIMAKLQREIKEAVPTSVEQPSWSSLEQLRYLGATITEGLRLSYGVATRSARAPHEALCYSPGDRYPNYPTDYIIPPYTPVSMTSVLVHQNPDIFPNPHAFIPERWLNQAGEKRKGLDAYLLTFSKGTRSCLGIKWVSVHFGP